MPISSTATSDCIAEAARLVLTNAGAAEQLLAVHYPGAHGRCAGCGSTPVRWPCVLVAIARRAQQLRHDGRDA